MGQVVPREKYSPESKVQTRIPISKGTWKGSSSGWDGVISSFDETLLEAGLQSQASSGTKQRPPGTGPKGLIITMIIVLIGKGQHSALSTTPGGTTGPVGHQGPAYSVLDKATLDWPPIRCGVPVTHLYQLSEQSLAASNFRFEIRFGSFLSTSISHGTILLFLFIFIFIFFY